MFIIVLMVTVYHAPLTETDMETVHEARTDRSLCTFLPTAYVVLEEVIFSVCLSVHIWGGYPIPGLGGGPARGTPPSRSRWGAHPGYPPSRSRWGPAQGTPHPGLGGGPAQGTPHPGLGGGPALGYPPIQV